MQLIYEKVLTPYLSQTKEDVIAYARNLIDSGNANNQQMANELSYMMRTRKRYDEAAEIAQLMYEKKSNIESLNLYFVAVVDQGDISAIRRLSDMAEEQVKMNGGCYQKHLFATWLKAANKILDDNLFLYVYSQIPVEEKNFNTYIISQYYVYKNRLGQYEDVCKHYEQLPPHIQKAFYVKRYYDNACWKLGYSQNPTIRYRVAEHTAEAPSIDMPTVAELKSAEVDRAKKIFVVYGGNPTNLTVIKTLLGVSGIMVIDLAEQVKTGCTIIEAFEKEANDTDFAIVLFTPENEGVNNVWYPRMNVVFEYGYFVARLGRNNVCMLRQDGGKKLDLPSDLGGMYHISLDKGTWIDELRASLKSAGFNVTF